MHSLYSRRVAAGDFIQAGEASSAIKRLLKQLGIDAAVVRRTAIGAYEAEINLVIHSLGGEMILDISDTRIRLTIRDDGPGIPSIEKAMTEGYSTASDAVRDMGFGAGMGLPNMRRNADEFSIESAMGVGTVIVMTFHFG